MLTDGAAQKRGSTAARVLVMPEGVMRSWWKEFRVPSRIARVVRHRHKLQDIPRDGIEARLGDGVVGKRLAGERIFDRCGEDAVALAIGEDLPDRRIAGGRLAIALVIAEKQQFVPNHW